MTTECKHEYMQSIGKTALTLDRFTCKKCGFVRYYEGGYGWLDNGGFKTGEMKVIMAKSGTGKSMLGVKDGSGN